MKYVYPAIFLEEYDGGYSVIFPDFSGGTQGNNLNEAITEATEALSLLISSYIDDGDELPKATKLKDVKLDEDFSDYQDRYIVSLIQADPEPYLNSNKVRKNVTIPKYLAQKGEKDNINFSRLLTEALELKYQ